MESSRHNEYDCHDDKHFINLTITCLIDATFCIAGGNDTDGGQQYGYSWYSYDSGQTWTNAQAIPTPSGGGYPPFQMNGVSCYASTVYGSQCVVGGRANNNLGVVAVGPVVSNQPINFSSSYTYSTSTIQPDFVDISGIHCSSNGNCVLSANLSNSSNLNTSLYPEYSGIYYSNDGGYSWSASQITTLAFQDSYTSNVSDVSCDKTGVHCVASGWYSTSSSNAPAKGLVYISNDGGVTWPTTIVFPNPSPDSNVNRLNAVRCSQTNSICYVTGHGGNENAGAEFPISYISYQTSIIFAG